MKEIGPSPVRGTDLLALGPKDRKLELEPIIDDEEYINAAMENRMPKFKGIAIHQHADVPRFTDDGVQIEPRCDYVVLDINQVMHLKSLLSEIKVMLKDGTVIDDE